MSLLEFDIIQQYFSKITTMKNSAELHLGIGDDAAIVSIPPNKKLVICTDTLNENIHFPKNTSAYDIGYKALAVNLSDLAAMGAQPKWFTLNISLPDINHDWLAGFSKGLQQLSNEYNLNLIGGDTTRGALSISITLAGHIEENQNLLRSAAKVGDKIYLSGCTGEAAYGLACVVSNNSNDRNKYFVSRLNRPTARVNLGLRLLGIANACIDISDGLVADVEHIAEASQCGVKLNLNAIPLANIENKDDALRYALTGGDDYELIFTVEKSKQADLDALKKEIDFDITCIGEVVKTKGVQLFENSKLVERPKTGFQHFKE